MKISRSDAMWMNRKETRPLECFIQNSMSYNEQAKKICPPVRDTFKFKVRPPAGFFAKLS